MMDTYFILIDVYYFSNRWPNPFEVYYLPSFQAIRQSERLVKYNTATVTFTCYNIPHRFDMILTTKNLKRKLYSKNKCVIRLIFKIKDSFGLSKNKRGSRTKSV